MDGTGRRPSVLVTGATGRQGSAVTRHLLAAGFGVRALTRSPDGDAATALARLGARVVGGDTEDSAALARACHGVEAVFSVQNPMTCGFEREVRQGRNVADAAAAADVSHLVYSAAGTGLPGTGIPSWESKLVVGQRLRELRLPVTVLRPMAFMELLTDRSYYPAVSTWHLMPRLMGEDRPVPWVCTDDLGAIVARVFAAPERYVGAELPLASDVLTLRECRELMRRVTGSTPRRFPMPVWMFKRFVGPDLILMWTWLRTGEVDLSTDVTRSILPTARSMEAWLRERVDGRV